MKLLNIFLVVISFIGIEFSKSPYLEFICTVLITVIILRFIFKIVLDTNKYNRL